MTAIAAHAAGMRACLLIATASLLACAERDPGGPLGSPADVHTAPGDYTGYRVVMPCTGLAGDEVGVLGTGTVAVSGADVSARGAELYALVDGGPYHDVLYGGGGTAVPCVGGATTTLFLGDWRAVDPVVAEVGAWLRANDLALEVAITITGPFAPVAE